MSFEDPQQQQPSQPQAPDDELNCTLWVGNLDSKIPEEQYSQCLYELFLQAGPIDKVHIPKSKDGSGHKGYSFVSFKHKESVPYSMNLFDGTFLYGREMRMQPRPGSIHARKALDGGHGREREFQQQQQQQHQQQLQIQQHGHTQQWFVAPPHHPQMAQMLVYPNQMFQAYPAGLPNTMPTVVQLPAGMAAHQLMSLPVHHQPQHQQQQAPLAHPAQEQLYRGPRPSGVYRNPRPPRPMTNGMTNGYAMHRHPNGNNAQFPSQYSQQSQVLNGSTHSQRFHSPRGPRPYGGQPRPHHIQQRNGNTVNGNANNYSQPTIYTSPAPAYHQSPPPPGVGGHQLQYQGERQYYPRPQQVAAPYPTGYQF